MSLPRLVLVLEVISADVSACANYVYVIYYYTNDLVLAHSSV